MYGYTPAAVIAVDPEWLADLGNVQRIAYALHRQLVRRPVIAVVGAPMQLLEAAPEDRQALVEALYDDPRAAPATVDDPATAVAEALRYHLRALGADLAIHAPPLPVQPHAGASMVVPGTWRDAAQAAEAVGARNVIGWTADATWSPRRVLGVPFLYERPDQAIAGPWGGSATL